MLTDDDDDDRTTYDEDEVSLRVVAWQVFLVLLNGSIRLRKLGDERRGRGTMELLLFATLAFAAQGADVSNNAPMKINADSSGGFLQQAPPSTLVAASMEREATLVEKASKRATAGVAVNKPNVLLVLVDDQGHGDIDLGVGKAEFHTPTLAALASEGVRLSNFYSGATCTPSRAMLMTGRYAMRYGFQDSVIHATEPRGVPLSETFLSEKMQKVGYTTAMIGKWCVHAPPSSLPPLTAAALSVCPCARLLRNGWCGGTKYSF